MADAKEAYSIRMERYDALRSELAGRLNRISNTRLAAALLGLGASLYLYWHGQNLWGTIIGLTAAVVFALLVLRHGWLRHEKKRADLLWEINNDAIKRIAGEWTSFPDNGADFFDSEHSYSDDLDLFGPGSLFQWINTAVTFQGRRRLKAMLTTPPQNYEEIIRRQGATEALADLVDWRQHFQVEAMMNKNAGKDPEALFRWAVQTHDFYQKPLVLLLVRILPPATLLLLAGAFLIPVIPFFVPLLTLSAQILMLALRFGEMSSILGSIDPYVNTIKVYRKMLQVFEQQDFDAGPIQDLRQKICSQGKTAGQQVRGLERITDRISIRYSELYLVINILTLWDYHCLYALERWKKDSGHLLQQWFEVLGEMEALSSLSIPRHDHPEWIVPVVHKASPRIFAGRMGHPLLPESRVVNDLNVMRKGQVFLITGSNMSGKSTLLRTVGINLVLAYAGTSVCAREFQCGIFSLFTSMRVRDDLKRNISSFYAELLRIKRMIESAKKGDSVFFLLDEIFKGTNSLDRHTGARILIKQLSREGALGLVSTHDVELGDLAEEDSRIRNFHFQEYYQDGQIYFDYKLQPGVSNTRNAIYLMEMAGIQLSEEGGSI